MVGSNEITGRLTPGTAGKDVSLNRSLYDASVPMAGQARIKQICLGIGYTAVTLADGNIGVAYTYLDAKSGCNLVRDYQDFEDRPAMDMLGLIESRNYLERSMALALINALNLSRIAHLPPDKDNAVLLDALDIDPASKVAMVGFIKPLAALLESKGVRVEVIDEFRGMGEKKHFYGLLSEWADAALITSTAIINNSVEEILNHLGPTVNAAFLGPSTPISTRAFSPWPAVKALAGIVPLDAAAVLKTVRHGLGTPFLHRYCRKVTLTRQHADEASTNKEIET